jgi:phosphoserine phosphatase
MVIVTLIAAQRLSAGDISSARDALAAAGCLPGDVAMIDADKACDIAIMGDRVAARAALEGLIDGIDIVVQNETERRRKLIIADMDSTMITVECIDELADYAGIKPQIAAITEAAMRGELDFEAALRSRVALLKGLSETVIETCLAERVRITSGAQALIRTVRAGGGHAVLVSGGFTRFAEPVARAIGFDRAIANQLGIADGVLDGTVVGDIVGAQTKCDTLHTVLAERGWGVAQSLAVGDGANDIPMIEAAGLGIAFHAKPKTAAAAAASLRYNDLSAILYAMGYPRAQWVND